MRASTGWTNYEKDSSNNIRWKDGRNKMQLWKDLQEYQRFEDTLIAVRMWSRRETKASHSQPILDTHLSARNLSASESSLDGVSDLVNND